MSTHIYSHASGFVMIAQLCGNIIELTGSTAIVDVSGVGYQVHCSRRLTEALELDKSAVLVIYTEVREDALRLYGFADKLEKQVFCLLLTVTGIGPKSASDILSKVDRLELLRIIGAGDTSGLQAIKGIGKKTAERIVVELKDRVGEYALERQETGLKVEREVVEPFSEAMEALQSLGFSVKDAERAVGKIDRSGLTQPFSSSEIVRQALQFV